MSDQIRFNEDPKYSYSKGELTLLAYIAFKRPGKKLHQHLIPKDANAWLEFQVHMVKGKRKFNYISEKDIRHAIRLTKPHMGKKKKPTVDPDLPDCYYWDENEVGDWLGSAGYSHLKETFKKNCISGRKLVTVDATALNRMGLRYFSEIKEVAVKIRQLLGNHSPNMMRAIMRRPPFNEYLTKKQLNGYSNSFFTFKKFCEANGFPYDLIEYNPCALIDSCCQLLIQDAKTKIIRSTASMAKGKYNKSSTDSADDSDTSLKHAPSVEYTVRHMDIRNKIIKDIIDALLDCVVTQPHRRKYGQDAAASRQHMMDILDSGFDELGLTEEELWERMEFAKQVAEGLMDEVRKTHKILQDIQAFKKTLTDQSVTDQEIEHIRDVASEFFDAVATVGALLAFGEFELENIFRQEPEFQDFVDEIVDEAEAVLNRRVLSADPFVRDVVAEAKHRILSMDLDLSSDDLRAVRSCAELLVDKMLGLALSGVDGLLTRSQLDLSDDYMPDADLHYFKRDSGSSTAFQPGSKSLTDMLSPSNSSPAKGDTTAAESDAEDKKGIESGSGRRTSEFTSNSSAGKGGYLQKLLSGSPIKGGGKEEEEKKVLARRPSDQDFNKAGLYRKDFVEEWARDQDSNGPLKHGQEGSESEHLQLVRITADQVVSNIVERALTHLLLDSQSEGNSEQILEVLNKVKMDNQEALRENRTSNPYNIDNEILRLWTPTVLSRQLDTVDEGAEPVESSPQGHQAHAQLNQEQNQKK